jgi:predicted ATPase
MAIKRITAKNFKSFEHVEIDLRDFNVIIGANASGKSNFIQIIRFLRDVAQFGLRNAISLQGDSEYLCNTRLGSSETLEISIDSTFSNSNSVDIQIDLSLGSHDGKDIYLRHTDAEYRFSLVFSETPHDFRVVSELLVLHGNLIEYASSRGDIIHSTIRSAPAVVGRGAIKISSDDVSYTTSNGIIIDSENGSSDLVSLRRRLQRRRIEQNQERRLLIESPFMFPLDFDLQSNFQGLAIYDFDSRLLRSAAILTGKSELEEDGSNLAIVLRNIIADPEKKRKLSNLVRDALPFVQEFDVETVADKLLLLKLKETYAPHFELPAPLMSDGTINVVALITALYFENKSVVVFEEPERNIHPFLIGRIVDMMKDAAKGRQIIVTTHNPEIVRNAGIESILLVSRDERGFSTISRPAQRETISRFLLNDIGIDELYVNNLLGI